MLSRFDGRRVRVTTEDGLVLVGRAEALPPGYGLAEFGVEEESLLVRGVHVFLSQIAKIDTLPQAGAPDAESFEGLVGSLLDEPCLILDTLPERVPKDAPGRYFAADRYFRAPERLAALYRRFAELMLRLNCYSSMAVTFDGGESWEAEPEPEGFAARVESLGGFMRAVFPEEGAMLELDSGDTWMSVWCPEGALLGRIRKLAAASGFFIWDEKEGR